jgi:hypothetical protein
MSHSASMTTTVWLVSVRVMTHSGQPLTASWPARRLLSGSAEAGVAGLHDRGRAV